jgi:lysosomal acid lipase/cholesteryl ester hydrolase
LNPDKDVVFWDFSFVERQADDQANIELIRQTVGQEKISVIVHSEASQTFWVAMSENPTWYEERVNLLIALGPVSRLDNIRTLLLRTLGVNGLVIGAIKALGIHEFFYQDFMTKLWFKTTCGLIPQFCRFSTYLISDGDTSIDDLEALRVYYGHYPAGISIKSLDHTLQIYRSGRFSYFDYGKTANAELYGNETAPLINLSAIKGVPISLFVGTTDLLSDVRDTAWLKEQLGDNVVDYTVTEYGHITYFIGKEVAYINDVVFQLNKYNNKEQSAPVDFLKSSS